MGVTLVSKCGSEFNASHQMYERALYLAQDYGWVPGKIKPPYHDFEIDDYDYLQPAGQTISHQDAKAISEALKVSLDDIPNDDQQGKKESCELSGLEYFSGGDFKEWLRQFAGFCAAGSFVVY